LRGFAALPARITIADPFAPADRFVQSSDVLVASDEPSTVLFTGCLQCPGKAFLSLNFLGRRSGDFYRDFPGVAYFEEREGFLKALRSIRDQRFAAEKLPADEPVSEFADSAEMIRVLLKGRENYGEDDRA
jgi:hypothetical protein